MNELIKVLAKIELFSGYNMRKTPFTNGYKPLFDFIGEKTKISGSIDLMGKEEFTPGTSGTVQITFIKGILNSNHFKIGETFTFGEGREPIGKGEIIEVINTG